MSRRKRREKKIRRKGRTLRLESLESRQLMAGMTDIPLQDGAPVASWEDVTSHTKAGDIEKLELDDFTIDVTFSLDQPGDYQTIMALQAQNSSDYDTAGILLQLRPDNTLRICIGQHQKYHHYSNIKYAFSELGREYRLTITKAADQLTVYADDELVHQETLPITSVDYQSRIPLLTELYAITSNKKTVHPLKGKIIDLDIYDKPLTPAQLSPAEQTEAPPLTDETEAAIAQDASLPSETSRAPTPVAFWDKITSHVDAGSIAKLELDNFTIDLDFRRDQLGGYQTILAMQAQSSSDYDTAGVILQLRPDNTLRVLIGQNQKYHYVSHINHVFDDTGQAYHLTIAKERSTLTVYLDGRQIHNEVLPTTAVDYDSRIQLKTEFLAVTSNRKVVHPLRGEIIEVNIYDTPLTPAQILAEETLEEAIDAITQSARPQFPSEPLEHVLDINLAPAGNAALNEDGSYSLDGKTGYLISDRNTDSLPAQASFVAQVNLHQIGTQQTVWSGYDPNHPGRWLIYVRADGRVCFNTRYDGEVVSENALVSGTTYTVIATLNTETDQAAIYIDGQLRGEGKINSNLHTSTPLQLGAMTTEQKRRPVRRYHLNGDIADMQVIDKVISPDQALKVHDALVAPKTKTSESTIEVEDGTHNQVFDPPKPIASVLSTLAIADSPVQIEEAISRGQLVRQQLLAERRAAQDALSRNTDDFDALAAQEQNLLAKVDDYSTQVDSIRTGISSRKGQLRREAEDRLRRYERELDRAQRELLQNRERQLSIRQDNTALQTQIETITSDISELESQLQAANARELLALQKQGVPFDEFFSSLLVRQSKHSLVTVDPAIKVLSTDGPGIVLHVQFPGDEVTVRIKDQPASGLGSHTLAISGGSIGTQAQLIMNTDAPAGTYTLELLASDRTTVLAQIPFHWNGQAVDVQYSADRWSADWYVQAINESLPLPLSTGNFTADAEDNIAREALLLKIQEFSEANKNGGSWGSDYFFSYADTQAGAHDQLARLAGLFISRAEMEERYYETYPQCRPENTEETVAREAAARGVTRQRYGHRYAFEYNRVHESVLNRVRNELTGLEQDLTRHNNAVRDIWVNSFLGAVNRIMHGESFDAAYRDFARRITTNSAMERIGFRSFKAETVWTSLVNAVFSEKGQETLRFWENEEAEKTFKAQEMVHRDAHEAWADALHRFEAGRTFDPQPEVTREQAKANAQFVAEETQALRAAAQDSYYANQAEERTYQRAQRLALNALMTSDHPYVVYARENFDLNELASQITTAQAQAMDEAATDTLMADATQSQDGLPPAIEQVAVQLAATEFWSGESHAQAYKSGDPTQPDKVVAHSGERLSPLATDPASTGQERTMVATAGQPGVSSPVEQTRRVYPSDPFQRDATAPSVIYLYDRDVLWGQGHGAVLLGSDAEGWYYFSFGVGLDGNWWDKLRTNDGNMDTAYFSTLSEARSSSRLARYDRFLQWSVADNTAIRAAFRTATEYLNTNYWFLGLNCDDVAVEIIRSSGIPLVEGVAPVTTLGRSALHADYSGEWGAQRHATGSESINAKNTMILVLYGADQFPGEGVAFDNLVLNLSRHFPEVWPFASGQHPIWKGPIPKISSTLSPEAAIQAIQDFITTRLTANSDIQNVVLVGYSWGGGVVYSIADWLTNESNFNITIAGTVYVDAVTHRSTAPEHRLPPGTLAMLNLYQSVATPLQQSEPFALHGEDIAASPNAGEPKIFQQIDFDAIGISQTHVSIDDYAWPLVLDFIASRVSR